MKGTLRNKKNPPLEQSIMQGIDSGKSLLTAEILVLEGEINIISKRVSIMKNFMRELGQQDPQYGILKIAIDADIINLDELKMKKLELAQVIESKELKKNKTN